MKTLNTIVAATSSILIATILLAGCGSLSKSARSKSKDPNVILDKIESQNYIVSLTGSLSSSGSSLDFGNEYFVKVAGDKVSVYMPFVGYSFRSAYKGGEGYNFDATVHDYIISVPEAGVLRVTFTARTVEDSYQIDMLVWTDGKAHLSITPHLKQGAAFYGELNI